MHLYEVYKQEQEQKILMLKISNASKIQNEQEAFQYIPKKNIFKEQFAEALNIIDDKLQKNELQKIILEYLNSNGFKTRIGKKWSQVILSNEIKKLRQKNNCK